MAVDVENASECVGADGADDIARTDTHLDAEAAPVQPTVEQLQLPGLEEDSALAIAPDDENGAQAPKFGVYVGAAELEIRRIDDEFNHAEARCTLGAPNTQAVLYRAIVDLERRGQVDEFIAERRVRRHGNAQNPYSPLLSALTEGAHPRVRQILAKTAAMFAFAREERVEPEKFAEWRQQWPIEKACKEWRDREKRRNGGQAEDMAVALFLASDAEFLGPVPQAVGYTGNQLFAVRCSEDGSGRVKFLRVLPTDKAGFDRIVKNAMRSQKNRKAQTG
jgi:hypothetical protein